MRPARRPHAFTRRLALVMLALSAAPTWAQSPAAPPAPATPATTATATPSSPVQSIRNKLSAADLLSAESIAEAWRSLHGADSAWLAGYSWLARGALIFGETAKARLYADSTRAYCAQRLAAGADLEKDGFLETALGAAIEVKAQLLERARGRAAAADYVRDEIANVKGPVSLLSRLHKRLDMLSLVGRPAPELVVEDHAAAPTATLAALRGKPVLVFVFNYGCGDCRGMAPLLEQIRTRHAAQGLQVVALTRWYDEPANRAAEKAALDSVWATTYKGLGDTPVVISTASMLDYGGSSTPTFAFLDRAGVVRGYTPTRLTDAEFEKALAPILK